MKNRLLPALLLLAGCSSVPKGELSQGRAPAQSAEQIQRKQIEVSRLSAVVQGIDGDLKVFCPPDRPCTLFDWAKETGEKYPHCSEFFIKEDGHLGKLGQIIFKYVGEDILAQDENSVFMKNYSDLGPDSMYIDKADKNRKKPICPQYSKFSRLEKAAFWSYVFEVTGFFEVTCNPKLKAPGVNTLAVGLYQLEWPKSKRSWRGGPCKESDKVILTPEGNTACAVHIFKWSLQKDGTFMSLIDGGKYKNFKYWHSHNLPHTPRDRTDPDSIHTVSGDTFRGSRLATNPTKFILGSCPTNSMRQ